MRVFHVQLRPSADRNTPLFFLAKDDAVLLQLAKGQHPDYQLVHAADVRCNVLDQAYMLTNSIDVAWFEAKHPLVQPTGLSKRSTSVNDFIVDGATVKVVSHIGFKRLAITADELVFDQAANPSVPA